MKGPLVRRFLTLVAAIAATLTLTVQSAAASAVSGIPLRIYQYLGPYGFYPGWCLIAGATLNIDSEARRATWRVTVISAADSGGGRCDIPVPTWMTRTVVINYTGGACITTDEFYDADGVATLASGCAYDRPGWWSISLQGSNQPIYGGSAPMNLSSWWVYG